MIPFKGLHDGKWIQAEIEAKFTIYKPWTTDVTSYIPPSNFNQLLGYVVEATSGAVGTACFLMADGTYSVSNWHTSNGTNRKFVSASDVYEKTSTSVIIKSPYWLGLTNTNTRSYFIMYK